MSDAIFQILKLLIVQFTLTVASLPMATLLFKKSTDEGYALAKLLGPIAVTYIVFTLVTIKIVPLTTGTIVGALGVWIVINTLIQWKWKTVSISAALGWRILRTECAFAILFSILAYIKSFQPEIYQIERFMDVGFLNTLANSSTLPLPDIWFSGQALNYYYFGHTIAHTVLTLMNTTVVQGFFLIQCWIFAALTIAVYRLGRDMFQVGSLFNIQDEQPSHTAGRMAGVLSAFAVVAAGTWYMVPWLVQYIGYEIGLRATEPNFFYPEPTRVIAGTITEMPSYSFLVSDLHGHVWGMLSGAMMLFAILALWHNRAKGLSPKNPILWWIPAILGIAYMANSWDAVTLGLLAVIAITWIFWKTELKTKIAIACVLVAIVSYVISLPWSFFFHAPVAGIAVVKQHSALWPWISVWGSVLIFPLIIALLAWREKQYWRRILKSPFGILLLVGILFLIIMELFYISDIKRDTEWYRADTVFKITTQVWLWLGVLLGPAMVWIYERIDRSRYRTIAVILLVAAVSIQLVYPLIAIPQAYTDNRERTGIDAGLDWWKTKYPNDYAAYEFMAQQRDTISGTNKLRVIAEAEGDSYTDVSRMSAMLGWPTIVGWPVHEWTWRGCYDIVAVRRVDVHELYTGESVEKAQEVVQKFGVNYIIVGQVEQNTYKKELKTEKIQKLGKVVFQQGTTMIIETPSPPPGTLNERTDKCPRT